MGQAVLPTLMNAGVGAPIGAYLGGDYARSKQRQAEEAESNTKQASAAGVVRDAAGRVVQGVADGIPIAARAIKGSAAKGMESGGVMGAAREIGNQARDQLMRNPGVQTVAGGALGLGALGAGAAGVHALTKKKQDGHEKDAAINRILAILRKEAGSESDEDSANISSSRSSVNPEDLPSQMARPSEVTSQESMIASNEAAINATKGEAKEVPKRRLGEVLSEPAMTSATDPVLSQNLDSTGQAGVKIASMSKTAAARAWLSKIASEGCRCKASGLEKGACDFCKVAPVLRGDAKGTP